MDITAIQGKINLSNIDINKSLTAYVTRPDARILARVRGVMKMDIKAKYIDISEVKFEVAKYIIDTSIHKFTLNPTYNMLHSFCCILIPELGKYGLLRIDEEPEVVANNVIDEKKVFTAYTYESILQYENLVRFDVNQGTETSLEMYSENLNGAGAPINKIQLYNPDNAKLSLLDLVLVDDYYGWSVGHVDESIRSKVRAFSVDSKNVYSFLMEDCAKAFRCIFDFDTINKQINVYDVETVGNNMNLYLSFQSFIHYMDISPTNEDVYTVFNVAGDNGLDISRVNFGSNKIVDISYPLSLLDDDIQNAYEEYTEYRESKREEYIDAYKRYTILLGQRNSILDRQPQEAVNNNWSSTVYYTLEELQTDLAVYQSIVDSILLLYTNQDGSIDYESLNKSPDASLYYSYHDVVIPDITAEIEARQSQSDDAAEEVDADTVWELYGLNELELKLKSYKNLVSSLREQGYDREWSQVSDSISKATWDAHHEEYVEYSGYVDELTALIAKKKSDLDNINAEINSCLSDIASIASLVKIDNYFSRFEDGASYVATIKSLYKESDYQDNNYLITDYDDSTSIVAESELLLEAAKERLAIESRPQLTWSVDSDNLFAIPELSKFRNHIQNGDFCTLVYDNQTNGNSINTYDGISLKNRFYGNTQKMRIIEIDFDGLNIGNTFNLTFSDVISTVGDVSDVESLIGSFVSSRTNSIQAATLSTASSTAKTIASSVIRPYIEAMRMQVANLESSQIYADDVEALRIKVDTLIADYMEANKASIFDLKAGTISADKSITLVARDGYGSIVMSNASMDFKDASDNTRVHIGKSDKGDSYSVDIYSAADSGGQKLLWSTEGITLDAIADGMITNAKLSEVSADKVTVGTLTSKDGSSYWNLDTGELSLNGYVVNAKVEYALGDSPSVAPTSGWSTNTPQWTVGKYVWQKTTLSRTGSEPEITTTCIQGASGRGILAVTEYYAINNSNSNPPTSWDTSFVAPTSDNPYLWNYTKTTYTDNTHADSIARVIGNYSSDGASGRGISSITEYYGLSSNSETEPTSWSTEMVTTTTTNKFLWNYETITYTDGSTEDSTKRIIGTHGATGSDAYQYSLIVSDSTISKNSNGALTPAKVTFTAKRGKGTGTPANYSGRFKVETTTDGDTYTTAYTSSGNQSSYTFTPNNDVKNIRVSLYLAGGVTNLLDSQNITIVNDGLSITDVTNYYLATNESTGVTKDTSGWTTNVSEAVISSNKQYLWNYEVSKDSNGSVVAETSPTIIGRYGLDGGTGEDGRGITSVVEYYALSDGATAPSDDSFTTSVQTPTVTNKYLWNYEKITYTDNSTVESQKHIIGVYGDTGEKGDKGDTGDKGDDAYTIVLTNESHTFAGSTTAALAGSTDCSVIAYKGTTQVAAKIGTITGQVTGLTTKISSNSTTNAKFTVTVTTSLTETSGVLTIPLTVDGKSFTRKFSWAVSRTGDKGDKGDKGDTGNGISSIVEYYAISDSNSDAPTSWQETFVAPTSDNPYLWNYSRTNYTDGSHDDTIALVVGNYSSDGENGRGIVSVTEYYGLSTANNVEPTEWSTSMVTTTTTNKFLWSYEVITYTDNTTEESTHRIISTHGANGTAAYNYELLVSTAAITKDKNGNLSPSSITFTGRRNQGTGKPANYAGRFKIETTADGDTWTTAYTSGANEATKTYNVTSTDKLIRCTFYLAGGVTTQLDIQTIPIVEDGADGISPTVTSSKTDGVTTVTITDASGTNTITINDGQDGASIASVTNYYLASASSSGVTPSTSGWTTNPTSSAATMTKAKPYLWNYEVSKDTDGNTIATTSPSIIGHFGADGKEGDDGRGITSIVEYYALSTTTTVPEDSEFDTDVKTPTSTNKYLWNYELITYTDSTSAPTSKRIIGVYGDKGDKGDDGVSPTITSSKTGGVTTVTIKDASGTKTLTINDGQEGASIASVTNYYLASASSSGVTTSTSGWTTNPTASAATMTASKPYLWNYEVSKDTDGKTIATTSPAIIGHFGKDGNNGSAGRGITSIAEYYALSTTTTVPEDSEFNTTVKTPTATNKYLWNYELITYTDSNTSTSAKHIIGVYGDTGSKGDKGDKGDDAYTVILTNESHTFAGTDSSAVASSTTCSVVAYKGATQVAATIGTITGQVTGLTTKISSNGTTSAKFTVTVTTALQTESGVLTVPITVDNKSFSKTFSWSLAKNGANGRGVVSITEYYAINNSTSAPTSWGTEFVSPTKDNPYLWNYNRTTYTDETHEDTIPLIIGNYSSDGENGRGISSISEHYGLSADDDTEPSSWSDTMVTTTTTNKFLWNYETITYTDGNTEDTTKRIIGTHGATGSAAYQYYLILSDDAIVKNADGVLSPSSITVTTKRARGTGSPANYAGRFKIEETVDGSTYTVVYTSSANQATYTFTPNSNAKSIRVSAYLAGGTTHLLDSQSIPIITDGADGENARSLQLLTPDGDSFIDNVGTLDIVAVMYNGLENDNQSVSAWSWSIKSGNDYVVIQGADTNTITINGADVTTSNTYKCTATYEGNQYTQYVTITNISPSSAMTLTTITATNETTTTVKAKLFASGSDITNTYAETYYSWLKVTERATEFIGHGYEVTVDNSDFGYGGVIRLVFSETGNYSGDVATFSVDTVYPLLNATVEFTPIQDTSSGAPSVSNVLPITGTDSVKVYRAGKNILVHPYFRADTYTHKGITYTVVKDDDGNVSYVSASGTATASSYYYFDSWGGHKTPLNNFIGKTVIISGSPDNSGTYINVQYRKPDTTTNISIARDTGSGKSFTVPTDLDDWNIYIAVTKDTVLDDERYYPMLRMESDSDSTYEPYKGETYDYDFSSIGTVYGGKLDLISGVLTVTQKSITVDGSEDWNEISTRDSIFCIIEKDMSLAPVHSSINPTNNIGYISTTYKYNDMEASVTSYSFRSNENGQWRLYVSTGATTLQAFKADLAAHPLQIIYTLATPLVYHLPPSNIETFVGSNNVWSDAGNINVGYYLE